MMTATYLSEACQKAFCSFDDSRMPEATELVLDAAAPKGAAAVGDVVLTDKAVDIATKVNQVNEAGIDLAYTFTASEQAGTEPFVRTVTYTVVEM